MNLCLFLFCTFALMTECIAQELTCSSSSFNGVGMELHASPGNQVDCGDRAGGSECPKQFVAVNNLCSDCDISIIINGRYKLLGTVLCQGNGSIYLDGSLNVGCCSSFTTTGPVNSATYSSILIGNNSALSVSTLTLEISANLVVGDNVKTIELVDSALTLGRYSDVTLADTAVQMSGSDIQIMRFSIFKFKGGNWYVANTILNSSPFSQIEFINSDSAFTGASIATDSARLTVDETSLSISYSNIFFNESETSWTSSSISLNGSFVRMQSDSTWTSFRSSLQLESAEVYLAKGSALEFYFCVIESNQAGLSINIGENATMTIATFSDYLFCNLKSNITVPENAIYTEANITDALECSSQKIEKTAKKIRKKSDQIVSRQTMLGSTIHMDSCPKKSFSTSTRKPIATSSTSHLIPETTKTSSKLTSGAGTKTYFIWILIFHILLIRQLA